MKNWPKSLSSSGDYKPTKASRKAVEAAMREVHNDIPETVERANVTGKRRERMLRAIALNKARKRK